LSATRAACESRAIGFPSIVATSIFERPIIPPFGMNPTWKPRSG